MACKRSRVQLSSAPFCFAAINPRRSRMLLRSAYQRLIFQREVEHKQKFSLSPALKIIYTCLIQEKNILKRTRPLLLIGIIEILVGGITLLATLATLLFSSTPKTPNVLCFVVITSIISTLLGIGIIRIHKTAYELLIYFSSVILLSKLLIFMNIIQLNGNLETSIPSSFKNLLSLVYHATIIVYLKRSDIRKIFYGNKIMAAEINLEKLPEVTLE